MAQAAILLDRDGVLNENRIDHVKSWEEFRFLPGVLAALRVLAATGLPLVVVTNQAIVNRGIVTQHTVDLIHQRMRSRVARSGGRLDLILSCPHSPEQACDCRKPQPGLLFRAAAELDIDLSASVFIGDALTDVEAGRRAGCKTVLVCTGRGPEAVSSLAANVDRWPDRIADDLYRAVPCIFELLRTVECHAPALAVGRQENGHEEIPRLQVAAHLADAAFGS